MDLANPGMDLTDGEKELLRCAGLDTYLLIRLARFGFDVTFYPFWTACVVVLPIYYSCNDQASVYDDGYLSLTINRVPDGSKKLIWIAVFTMLLYLFIMRRLWIEWEGMNCFELLRIDNRDTTLTPDNNLILFLPKQVFIKLRHSFLTNGDTSFHKRLTYLRKYRNTCMVECVPSKLRYDFVVYVCSHYTPILTMLTSHTESHRTDRNICMFFESLFPGQIEHAEMLIDTSKLEDILKKRRNLIEQYDNIDSKYRYECWRYTSWQRGHIGCGTVAEPVKPKVRQQQSCTSRLFLFYITSSYLDEQCYHIKGKKRRPLLQKNRRCVRPFQWEDQQSWSIGWRRVWKHRHSKAEMAWWEPTEIIITAGRRCS